MTLEYKFDILIFIIFKVLIFIILIARNLQLSSAKQVWFYL